MAHRAPGEQPRGDLRHGRKRDGLGEALPGHQRVAGDVAEHVLAYRPLLVQQAQEPLAGSSRALTAVTASSPVGTGDPASTAGLSTIVELTFTGEPERLAARPAHRPPDPLSRCPAGPGTGAATR